MKKLFVAIMVAFSMTLVGCSEPVPVGTVGKKIVPEGVTPEIYQPGRVTLWWRQSLVLVETASKRRVAPVTVVMADHSISEDGSVKRELGLDMDFIVNIRYKIKPNENVINAMLNDMTLDGVEKITAEQVYDKYGNQVVGRVSREILGEYSPEEIFDNLKDINKALHAGIVQATQNTPLEISEVSLGKIDLPKIIKDRINANKSTELSEAEKRAQQKIDLLNEKNQTELAKQKAVRDMVDAKSLAEQNRILSESVTPEVIKLRELEVEKMRIEMMSKVLSNGNNNSVFIPYGALDNPGSQMRMFQK